MNDALGDPQSLLVLGGTSEIALAVVDRLATGHLRRVVLAGRDSQALNAAAQRVRGMGPDVAIVAFDAEDVDRHPRALETAWAGGDVDVVLLAFGQLGDQTRTENDPVHAVQLVRVNFVGAVSIGTLVAQRLRAQGHGVLVVLSSVAAERPRRSNYVYGSTKAGLDAFATGLGDALRGSGARVMVVRPGFVRTRMTVDRPEAPLATTPAAVADAIADGLRRRREVVWVPGVLRYVMIGVRHLPRAVFRRLPV